MDASHARAYRAFQIAFSVYLFVLVLAMYPHTADPTGDIKRLTTAWFAFLAPGAWIWTAWRLKIPLVRPRLFPYVFGALLILMLIASLRSEFARYGLSIVGRFSAGFALYWLATQLFRTPQSLRLPLTALSLAVVIAAFYGFLQLTSPELDPFPWDDRESDVYTNLPATFGNPNYAAHTLILAMIVSAFLLATGSLWAVPLLIVFAAHLYYTDQRAGWIALAAASTLLIAAAVLRKVLRRPVAAAGAAMLLTACAGIAGAGLVMWQTQQRTGHLFPLDVSLLIRYQSYVSATEMIRDAPLLGHGPGVYGIAYGRYWTPFEQQWFAQERRMNEHVHNDLMEISIDAGIPAAAMYLTLLLLAIGYGLWMALSAGPWARRAAGGMFAAFFMAYLVDGLFGFNLRVPVSAALFYFMLGALESMVSTAAPVQRFGLGPRGAMALRVAATVLLFAEAVLESLRFGGQYQLQQARAALGARDYAAAIDHAHFGEWLVPWNPHFARIEGHVHLELQDAPRAAAALTRSLKINPHYILTHLPLGNTKLILAQQRLLKKDDEAMRESLALVSEAEEHARAVLRICPMYARAESLLARAASMAAALRAASTEVAEHSRATEDWRRAEKHLLRALELGAPTQGELYERLAGVRIALNDMAGAEAALVRGAQTAPDRPEIWAAFLNFANRFGDYDRLRQTLYDQIARLQEEGPRPRPGETEEEAAAARERALTDMNLMLANVLENSNGSMEDALAAYDSAIAHGGLRPEVWANYARFARAKERWPDFVADVRAAAARADEAATNALAQVLLAARALSEGVPALEPVTALTLEQVRAYPLGAPLSVGEAWGWVVALLSEVYSGDPGAAGCASSLNLGMLYAAIRLPEHAESLFQRADGCADDAQRPYLYAHWAQALGAQNRAAEAVGMLREAVKRYPEAVDLRWAYARTLRASGLLDEARAQYDLLLQQPGLDPRGLEMLKAERAAL